jgi:pyruvate formate lyase activating enzyme
LTADLHVGGFTPLSSVDWPGELVATVFCQGCPWDCRYCYNQSLRPVRSAEERDWRDILAFLDNREGLIDGVVFTGGEPLLQAALPAAMSAVRNLGFRVGLHTGGAYPKRFAQVLPLVDWVGFDIKAAFEDYARITKVCSSGGKARRSLEMLLASGIARQTRTTIHPLLLDESALARLRRDLSKFGISDHVFQAFQAEGCIDTDLCAAPAGSCT